MLSGKSFSNYKVALPPKQIVTGAKDYKCHLMIKAPASEQPRVLPPFLPQGSLFAERQRDVMVKSMDSGTRLSGFISSSFAHSVFYSKPLLAYLHNGCLNNK